MKKTVAILLAVWAAGLMAQAPEGLRNGLRGSTPLDKEAAPPVMPKMTNDDIRKGRAFAMQPPVIPHQIEDYQVDRNYNKCMTCHGRDRVADSQAPMVSVTHFVDREGNFRAEISPRRYFCTQCHVPQMEVKVPVVNGFEDAVKAAVPREGKGK
jgi:cytochrome c-type protein NapB